jgi:6-bladed beta-propeller
MRTAASMLLAMIAAACGSDQDRGLRDPASVPMTHPTVRDSAGVVIVEHTSLAGGDSTSWRIALSDTTRIGLFGITPEGDERYLARDVGAARLADGRVAVADQLAYSVRIFEADGSFSEAVGRRGEGPGEFVSLGGLFRIGGDSLLAVDQGPRWTLLDPFGNFVQTKPLYLSTQVGHM